jgi:hypothetical protein
MAARTPSETSQPKRSMRARASAEASVQPSCMPTDGDGAGAGSQRLPVRMGAFRSGSVNITVPRVSTARSPTNALWSKPGRSVVVPSSNSACGGGSDENMAPASARRPRVHRPTIRRSAAPASTAATPGRRWRPPRRGAVPVRGAGRGRQPTGAAQLGPGEPVVAGEDGPVQAGVAHVRDGRERVAVLVEDGSSGHDVAAHFAVPCARHLQAPAGGAAADGSGHEAAQAAVHEVVLVGGEERRDAGLGVHGPREVVRVRQLPFRPARDSQPLHAVPAPRRRAPSARPTRSPRGHGRLRPGAASPASRTRPPPV